jgi:hypothetical protein
MVFVEAPFRAACLRVPNGRRRAAKEDCEKMPLRRHPDPAQWEKDLWHFPQAQLREGSRPLSNQPNTEILRRPDQIGTPQDDTLRAFSAACEARLYEEHRDPESSHSPRRRRGESVTRCKHMQHKRAGAFTRESPAAERCHIGLQTKL